MTGVPSFLHDPPADVASAMRVLEELIGGPGPACATASGASWPGGLRAAAPVEPGAAARGGAAALPRGAVGTAGGIATASAIMQKIRRSAERAQVEAAIQRFGLDRADAAQLLSARACVWGRNIAPMLFWDVPYTGATNERVAQAIAASGWKMDAAENLIALSANLAAYLVQGPVPLLPYHAGDHPQYSLRVDAALAKVAASSATGQALRTLLATDEAALRAYILRVAPLGLLP